MTVTDEDNGARPVWDVAGRPQRQLIGLLDRIAVGDADAFAEFSRRTHRRVFESAMSIVRRRMAAEEVSQEVYLLVWLRAHTYPECRRSGPACKQSGEHQPRGP